MNLEELIRSVQMKLTFEESQQLIEALKSKPDKVLELFTFCPKESADAFIHKLMLCFEWEKAKANTDHIGDLDTLEKIALDMSEEFRSLVEELSTYHLSDIKQIIITIDKPNAYVHGNFIAGHLVHTLVEFLDTEDFENLISYEETHHLY